MDINVEKIRENGIMVLTPMYGGQCFGAYAKSMMGLTALCVQHAIPLDFYVISAESLIPRARNYCIDVALRKKFKREEKEYDYKHIIFIDSDIGFNPIDVLVLAHLQNEGDKKVICGVYPKKRIAWEKVKTAVDKGFANKNPNDLQLFGGDFVFNAATSKTQINLGDVIEVNESGTGFMMMSRELLLDFAEKYPELSYKPDHVTTEDFNGSREITAFFDCVIDPETKRYLSEDYFFCKKVREMGEKVWIFPPVKLEHHGYYIYNGDLGMMAQAGVAATV